MAEQINIQVITNSLRNLAKAWAEANRQSQLNKERRRKLEDEAKRLRKPVEQAKPWPGAVPESQTKGELAAFRNAAVRLAWCWTRQTAVDNPSLSSLQTVSNTQIGGYYRAPISRTFLIVSGNGSVTQSVALNMPESAAVRAALPADYSAAWAGLGEVSLLGTNNFILFPKLLPTGTDGVGILVLDYHYVFLSQILGTDNPGDPLTEYYQAAYANRRLRCFLVGPATIRELSVPAAFSDAVDASSTKWVITDGPNPVTTDPGSPYYGMTLPLQPQISATPTYYTPPSGSYYAGWGFWSAYPVGVSTYTTPLEFQRLALVDAYSPPAQSVWVEADTTTAPGLFADYSGGLFEWGDAINQRNPVRWRSRPYARGSVPEDGAPGDLPPTSRLTRQMDAAASVPPRVGSALYFMHFAHDYGEKAKCRSALLALGFTTADLTP